MRDGRIIDIAPTADTFTSLYPGAAVVDASSSLIIPGFVNVHHHGESTLLQFLTRTAPSASWPAIQAVREVTSLLLDPDSHRGVRELYRATSLSHLMSGTTTVSEYPLGYTPGALRALLEGVVATGIRTLLTLQSWEQIEAARELSRDRTTYAVALGPEDTYTTYSLEQHVRAAKDLGCPLSAHIGEHKQETETLRRNFKKAPLRVLKEYGALKSDTHLLHCNYLNSEDLTLAQEEGATLTVSARSTASKQTGYPLLRLLGGVDVRLSLGTDWGSMDMLEEMKFLRRLPKILPGVPVFSPLELLRMATINGAHALGLTQQSGSLEIGKKADLLMVSLDDVRVPALRERPSAEEVAEVLIDYGNAGMITDVMIDGRFRLRHGKVLGVDSQEIRHAFRVLQQLSLSGGGTDGANAEKARGTLPFGGANRKGEPGDGIFEHGNAPAENNVPVGTPRRANLTHPGTGDGELPEKVAGRPKKIDKIFGEDES